MKPRSGTTFLMFTTLAKATWLVNTSSADRELVAIAHTTRITRSPAMIREDSTPNPTVKPPPEYLTIAIVNRQTVPISTSHASNIGGPSPVWGDNGPGTIASGVAAAVVVPTGWAGNVAIFNAGTNGSSPAPLTNSSLIEASFVVPEGYGTAVADVDVSFVNGFSSPITCACSGVVVTGCSHDLWDLAACPDDDNNNGACANPLRPYLNATTATHFFAPCQGAAYTFPHDDGANSFAECQSGEITCCVGKDCPSNSKQIHDPQGRRLLRRVNG
ncbi:uncharacterized protein E0L32_004646 [Thyridium curvatum]|uniref:Thaumatin-like protein n=1 Tax=Thyridium curvatum TaxID=1093900 RepID=A0A507BD83_9PEZI|nr:uncharacterized protein E0L32_004646 [Thyridium curvatum]TPX15369.1 hypothetical protein E0L32_004646 [Thyridium curvatum]